MKRTPLRQRSKKTAKVYRTQRIPLVKKMLDEHELCQRCKSSRSVDVHEIQPRGRGGSITDESNCVAICRDCHNWIHQHPRLAKEGGWLA